MRLRIRDTGPIYDSIEQVAIQVEGLTAGLSRASFLDQHGQTVISAEEVVLSLTATGGGSQPTISDVIVVSVQPTLDTSNGWANTAVLADVQVDHQRGTDLSVVNASGAAGLHSVLGGDFLANVFTNVGVTLDGGSTDQRWLGEFTNAPPAPLEPLSNAGIDMLTPLFAPSAQDMRTAQPFFAVPPGGLVTDVLSGFFCQNATGTDSFVVAATLTFWKIGALA